MKFNFWEWVALCFVIIGALNWGLIGLFNFDLLFALIGQSMPVIINVIYSLIGLAGLYSILILAKIKESA